MTGYEAFCLFNSIKIHFQNPTYDFFKYHGKSKISLNAFEHRKDKYYFYKLSRQYQKEEFIEFVVSCHLSKEKIWAGDLLQEEMIQFHRQRMSTIQSLGYTFKEDCVILQELNENFNSLLKCDDSYPMLLTKTLHKEIKLETLIVLNSLMNFFPMWDKKIEDTLRWPIFKQMCMKYQPFLVFDKAKFRDILLSVYK